MLANGSSGISSPGFEGIVPRKTARESSEDEWEAARARARENDAARAEKGDGAE